MRDDYVRVEEIECEKFDDGECDGPALWDLETYKEHCAPGSNQYKCMRYRVINRLKQEAEIGGQNA